MSNVQLVARALRMAICACLILSAAAACATTTVEASARVAYADKATYGPLWPFRSDSVVGRCVAATGHPARLSISIESTTYAVDASGRGLPDQVIRVGGRQDFPALYARLITGC